MVDQWVVFVGGRYTTAVTVYDHEPSQSQTRDVKRLHEDFEDANNSLLAAETVEAGGLVSPFHLLIREARDS